MKYLKRYENIKNFNNIIKIIEKSPLTKDLRKCNNLLYHNTEDKNIKNYLIINHKKRDKPTDTPKTLHKYISTIARKKLNWSIREDSIFVHNGKINNNNNIFNTIGEEYIIFPINNYKLSWEPNIIDMYDFLYDKFSIIRNWYNWWFEFPKIINGEIEKPNLPIIEDDLKDNENEIKNVYKFLDNYIDNIKFDNLCDWLKSNVEGMMKSKKYILINVKYKKDIIKYIWG